eukprot:4455296-Pyramimonas_sp.AAC.1
MDQRALRNLSAAITRNNNRSTAPCCRPRAVAGVYSHFRCHPSEKVDGLLLVLMHFLKGHSATGEAQALEVRKLRPSGATMILK